MRTAFGGEEGWHGGLGAPWAPPGLLSASRAPWEMDASKQNLKLIVLKGSHNHRVQGRQQGLVVVKSHSNQIINSDLKTNSPSESAVTFSTLFTPLSP